MTLNFRYLDHMSLVYKFSVSVKKDKLDPGYIYLSLYYFSPVKVGEVVLQLFSYISNVGDIRTLVLSLMFSGTDIEY